jgi:hypothetical protein
MKVELKICERCGAIWLRPLNTGWTYCSPCFPVIRAMVHGSSLRRATQRTQKAGAR